MITDLTETLEPDNIFYDIGASLGLHSVFAAQKLSNGAVFAFEPHGWNFTRLESNVSNNPISIETYNIALSDSGGQVQFDRERESIAAENCDTDESTEPVKAVEGDQFIADEQLPQPGIVKIDVEGAEMLVVEGLRRALSNETCRRVYCEIHLPAEHRESIQSYGTSGIQLMTCLSELGFDIEIIDTRGREIQLVGSK